MSRVVFENASLFDGVSPQLARLMFVLVDGGEIKEVSAHPIRVDGAERIDCSGKTVIPGLIDNHVHIYLESLNLNPPEPPITYRAQFAQQFLRYMLSCGFTTVRDVAGGDHGMAMALRDGFLEGPRFYYGGLCLTQTGGHGDMRLMSQPSDCCSCGAMHNVFAVHADGVDECIKATREELRKGASHIKILASGGILSPTGAVNRSQYSEAEIRAIVDECARHGSYVCAHAYPAPAIRRCVEFGVRCIEHGSLIDEETAAFVAERGAYVVPTMAMIVALKEDLFAPGKCQEGGMLEVSRGKVGEVYERAFEGLRLMKRAGVKMGFGTDLIGRDQYTRVGTEFLLRGRVLSPFDILHSATAINAEILQLEGKLGVVRAGALADLLVVDGNPLEDIGLLAQNGRHLSYILVDGRFVKRPIGSRFSGLSV